MAKRYHLTQKDRDLIGRTIKTVQGMGRGERPLPRRPRRPMGDAEETFRLIRGESVGIQSGATILIDNVVVLSGGIDPSGGNPATQVRVANLFGQSFTDNEKVQAIYSPAVVASPLTDWEAVKTTTGTDNYRLIRGLAKGDVTADDTTFIVDNVLPLAAGLDPVSGNAATEITVQNIQKEGFEDNTPVTCVWDGTNWELLLVERYRLVRGLAAGAVNGESSFPIDNLKVLASGLDPRSDPTSMAETLTIQNIFGDSYLDNEIVVAVYNVVDNQWEAFENKAATSEKDTYVCTLAGTISAGTTTNMGPGTGTVYAIGTGSGLTSLGTRTIYNPYLTALPATAPGSETLLYTCSKTHDDPTDANDKFTITGVDWLRVFATIAGFGQYKILWASDAATPTAADIEWAGAEC